jgi:hypothetical protein
MASIMKRQEVTAIVGHVRAHEGLPLGGKLAFSRLDAAMVTEPVENGRHPSSVAE